MRRVWAFLTLRQVIDLTLPGDPAAVAERLADQIKPRKLFRSRFERGYEGEVSPGGFTISCIGESRYDSRPAVVVHGTFRESAGGTLASIVVRHGRLTAVVAWLLLALSAGGISAAVYLSRTNAGLAAPLLVAAWWVFVLVPGLWLFVNCGAWIAVRKVGRDVRELLG